MFSKGDRGRENASEGSRALVTVYIPSPLPVQVEEGGQLSRTPVMRHTWT